MKAHVYCELCTCIVTASPRKALCTSSNFVLWTVTTDAAIVVTELPLAAALVRKVEPSMLILPVFCE